MHHQVSPRQPRKKAIRVKVQENGWTWYILSEGQMEEGTEKRLERLRDGEQGEVPRGRGKKAVSCDRERRRPRNIIMYNANSNSSE